MSGLLEGGRAAAAGALGWWLSQLGSFRPERATATSERPAALARVSREATVIEREGVAPLRLAPIASMSADDAGRLADLMDSHELSIALGRHEAQHLSLTLPRAARRHLDQAIGFQLGTGSAVRAEDVVYVAGTSSVEGDMLKVPVVLVRRATLEQLTEAWQRLGLPPAPVGLAAPGAHALDTVFVAPPRSGGGRRSPSTILAALLAVLVVAAPVATATVLEISSERARAAAATLQSEVGPKLAARADAVAAVALRERLQAPLASPRLAELIARLAPALPPDAWVSRLDWSRGEARLEVVGADAATVRTALQRRRGWEVTGAVDRSGFAEIRLAFRPMRGIAR